MNEEAGKLLLEDYAQYASRAKLMTNIHAIAKLEAKTVETGLKNIAGVLTSSGANKNASPIKKSVLSASAAERVAKKVDKKGLKRL